MGIGQPRAVADIICNPSTQKAERDCEFKANLTFTEHSNLNWAMTFYNNNNVIIKKFLKHKKNTKYKNMATE